MKMFIGAIALLIAAPVAAQTAPAGDPHAGHAQHQQGDHGKHQDHSKHGDGKAKDCCKDGKHGECCDKAKQQGQKMDCCAGHESKGGDQAAHGGHAH